VACMRHRRRICNSYGDGNNVSLAYSFIASGNPDSRFMDQYVGDAAAWPREPAFDERDVSCRGCTRLSPSHAAAPLPPPGVGEDKPLLFKRC
jgi:hypothetical protein